MESKKKTNNPKRKSREFYNNPEDAQTTYSQDIMKVDTSLMPSNLKVEKMLICMNEKLEKEIDNLKQKNDEIVKSNFEIIASEARLKETVKWYEKISFGKRIFSILIGVSVTTLITLDNEIFPKVYSLIILIISLFFDFYLFRKDSKVYDEKNKRK